MAHRCVCYPNDRGYVTGGAVARSLQIVLRSSRGTGVDSIVTRVVGDCVDVSVTVSMQLEQYVVGSGTPVSALTTAYGLYVRSRQMAHINSWSGSGTLSRISRACLHSQVSRQHKAHPRTPWHVSAHRTVGLQWPHSGSSEAGIDVPTSGTRHNVVSGLKLPPGSTALARNPTSCTRRARGWRRWCRSSV